MAKKDPLEHLTGYAVCPVCGCFDRKGMYRCSECGTFHAGGIMEEREAPSASELRESTPAQTIDPSIYSVGPNATIPEEKDPTELNMEEALILIEKRREYDRNKKKKKK